MRRPSRIALSVALALLTLSPIVSAQNTPAAPNDHILRAAVVRVIYIYRNMQEAGQSLQSRKNHVTQIQAEQRKREEDIANLVNQLMQFKAGSPQWAAMRDTVDERKLALESWGKKMQIDIDRENKKGLMDQYRHVSEAVQTIALQLHLDLVVADTTPEIVGPDFDQISQQELQQSVLGRAVLFAGKKADVTQEVLTLVDANYAKEKQAVGAVPPAPGVNPVAPNPAGH